MTPVIIYSRHFHEVDQTVVIMRCSLTSIALLTLLRRLIWKALKCSFKCAHIHAHSTPQALTASC